MYIISHLEIGTNLPELFLCILLWSDLLSGIFHFIFIIDTSTHVRIPLPFAHLHSAPAPAPYLPLAITALLSVSTVYA